MINTNVSGNFFATLSVILGSVTWFSNNGELIFRCLTGLTTVITAIFACRYYYYATLEKKKK